MQIATILIYYNHQRSRMPQNPTAIRLRDKWSPTIASRPTGKVVGRHLLDRHVTIRKRRESEIALASLRVIVIVHFDYDDNGDIRDAAVIKWHDFTSAFNANVLNIAFITIRQNIQK